MDESYNPISVTYHQRSKMMTAISADFPFKAHYIEVHGSKMHYLQEDHPHQIGTVLAEWYQSL